MTPDTPAASPYWRKTLRLSAVLLAMWLVLTVAVGLFGNTLTFSVLGWPFGFWVTAQGALIVYCGIVWVYAVVMDRLDRVYGAHDGD